MESEHLRAPLNMTFFNVSELPYYHYCADGIEAAALKTCMLVESNVHTGFNFVEGFGIMFLKYASLVVSTITGILILSQK